MSVKLVLVGIERAPFNEHAWNEFEAEMAARDWTQLPENESLFAATVEAASSDSSILRTVNTCIEEVADGCGVTGCEATCVVADGPA